jgi:hypothetical protein
MNKLKVLDIMKHDKINEIGTRYFGLKMSKGSTTKISQ